MRVGRESNESPTRVGRESDESQMRVRQESNKILTRVRREFDKIPTRVQQEFDKIPMRVRRESTNIFECLCQLVSSWDTSEDTYFILIQIFTLLYHMLPGAEGRAHPIFYLYSFYFSYSWCCCRLWP